MCDVSIIDFTGHRLNPGGFLLIRHVDRRQSSARGQRAGGRLYLLSGAAELSAVLRLIDRAPAARIGASRGLASRGLPAWILGCVVEAARLDPLSEV